MAATVPHIAELTAPLSWRTVDFISDLHLHISEPATFTAWQRYMQSTPADAVFILGDLFEVWIATTRWATTSLVLKAAAPRCWARRPTGCRCFSCMATVISWWGSG